MHGERKVYDEVLSMIMERARALRVDLPDAPGAQLGPSASFAQRDFSKRWSMAHARTVPKF